MGSARWSCFMLQSSSHIPASAPKTSRHQARADKPKIHGLDGKIWIILDKLRWNYDEITMKLQETMGFTMFFFLLYKRQHIQGLRLKDDLTALLCRCFSALALAIESNMTAKGYLVPRVWRGICSKLSAITKSKVRYLMTPDVLDTKLLLNLLDQAAPTSHLVAIFGTLGSIRKSKGWTDL